MKLSRVIKTGLVLLSVGVVSSFANLISYSDLTSGSSSVTLSGYATVTGSSAFQQKTVAGVTATGIAGGYVDGEIDGSEFIKVTFVQPQKVDEFQLAFLYAAGNWGDAANEFAVISDNGLTTTHKLSLTSATTATWDGVTTNVSCLSPGLDPWHTTNGGDAGLFQVSNPFGNDLVSSIVFKANPLATGASSADYAFEQLASHSVPVPEPSSMSFIIIGLASLVGLGVARKRK